MQNMLIVFEQWIIDKAQNCESYAPQNSDIQKREHKHTKSLPWHVWKRALNGERKKNAEIFITNLISMHDLGIVLSNQDRLIEWMPWREALTAFNKNCYQTIDLKSKNIARIESKKKNEMKFHTEFFDLVCTRRDNVAMQVSK